MLNTIINGNCKDIFPQIAQKYNNIFVLTDPPYNIQFKGYDLYEDNLPDDEYIDLIKTFKDHPIAIIQYPEEMMKYIVPALGLPDEVISWCYNSNIPKRFRLVNVYGRFPDYSKVLQAFKNPNDKRIKFKMDRGDEGAPIYDWFSDIQLVNNVSREKTEHPCQVPVRLLERLLRILAQPNDVVVDPFMGVGSTAIACKMLKIPYIGIEMSKRYCEIAEARINKYEDAKQEIYDDWEEYMLNRPE